MASGDQDRTAGWISGLPTFRDAEPRVVCLHLREFVGQAGERQEKAWLSWVPRLQRETDLLLRAHEPSKAYTAILEYRLPRDFRRPDVIVLEQGIVVVLELKGGVPATQAGLDQVLAYARDLRAYHALCHHRPVVPVLVPSQAGDTPENADGAWVVGPGGIHGLLTRLAKDLRADPQNPDDFLQGDVYAPLPTIVQAARDLFEHGDLPYIKRARACTDPALQAITAIAKEAAATRTRHLVMLTGVPGSGKTLVGLQLAHAKWLDALAVPRADGQKKTPAVYLSGNQPLVSVLQDALKGAGGGGKAFVQHIKSYVDHYSRKADCAPPEHLIVFDEAQRAFDAGRVARVHKTTIGDSEPEHLLNFLRRVPDWCVLVALVGSGQAINQGEEGGLPLWREALLKAGRGVWTVHAAQQAEAQLAGGGYEILWKPELNLDTEIRHHLVPRVHEWVEAVLDYGDADRAAQIATSIHEGGHRFLLTRDLEAARSYLRERFEDAPRARYGLVASSRDKDLPGHGVDNTWQTTKIMRHGPWFNSEPADARSCCQLTLVATEFAVQGLELDMALLAWGTDLVRTGGRWSNDRSRRHQGGVKDALALRRNAYRVLLTRGRDGTIVFVPPSGDLDETAQFLTQAGMRALVPPGEFGNSAS